MWECVVRVCELTHLFFHLYSIYTLDEPPRLHNIYCTLCDCLMANSMTCWHFYPKCNDYDFKKAIIVLIEMNFLADFAGENEVCQIKDHFYWCCGSLGIWGQIPDHRTVKEIISVWWNPTCHFKKKFYLRPHEYILLHQVAWHPVLDLAVWIWVGEERIL